MKLFQHSSGMIVAFGFDMIKREQNVSIVCWSDPQTKSWEMKADNMAGYNLLPPQWNISPEFIFEDRQGRILAYSPGACLVMTLIGQPLVWSFSRMTPDNSGMLRSAA